MDRRTFLVSSGMMGFVAGAVGCQPPYRYLRMAPQSPLAGVRAISLEAIHFEAMRVGDISEGEYLAGKNSDQQASFEADKDEFARRFVEILSGRCPIQVILGPPPDPSVCIVRPMLLRYEPGVFTGFFNRPTEVNLVV